MNQTSISTIKSKFLKVMYNINKGKEEAEKASFAKVDFLIESNFLLSVEKGK